MSQEYPAFPEGSGYADQEAYNASMQQPASIKTAVNVMRAGAALSAIYLVISLITLGSLKDDIKEQLQTDGTDYSQSQLDTAYNIAVGSVVIFGVIGVLLWLWMASANGKGRNWARIVATVLGAINIIFSLLGLIGGQATLTAMVFTVLNLVIAVAALVFMYKSDARAYYAASSRR